VADFFDALYDAEAEVVINADNHFYERFEPQNPEGEEDDEGIRQFTVGTGGRSLDSIGAPAANSAVRFNEGYGVLALTLFPGGYEWNFVTEPDIVFSDGGTADCH
jgi:oligoribonuclease NrnB/cAMP/cGMP phosphodiesterase (DHH superfamily)